MHRARQADMGGPSVHTNNEARTGNRGGLVDGNMDAAPGGERPTAGDLDGKAVALPAAVPPGHG